MAKEKVIFDTMEKKKKCTFDLRTENKYCKRPLFLFT